MGSFGEGYVDLYCTVHCTRSSKLTVSFQRGRAYLISPENLDVPLTGRNEFGCNCFSSGEPSYVELIMPKAYKSMLDYFKVVTDNPGYEAEPQDFSEIKDDHGNNVGGEP